MRVIRSQVGFILSASIVIVSCLGGGLQARQASPEKPAAVTAPIINGVWKLNGAASAPGGDLGGGQGGQGSRSAGGRSGSGGGSRGGGFGGRGGAGGGSRGGGSFEQAQKLHALVIEVTTMPDRLTVNLNEAEVSLTYDTGQVLRYSTSGKEEKHDFTVGSAKVKTTWAGGLLTQHIDLGSDLKLVGTYAVSGDQLVVRFVRDTGATASTATAADRDAPERRWVYDPVR
jgi:hypothetical protein